MSFFGEKGVCPFLVRRVCVLFWVRRVCVFFGEKGVCLFGEKGVCVSFWVRRVCVCPFW